GLLTLSGVVRADLHSEEIDLTATAEEVAQEIRETAPGRAVEIAIHRGMRVVGDRVLIRAALTNLIGNAWKFTSKSQNARIEIGEKKGGSGEKVFFVRDNGAGFDMKNAAKLFGAFQRLHGEEDFQGTGIGLATVQRIIAKHGGRIWAEAYPNQGATF